MITRPTVLILGAGASKDYDFPTGRELLIEIVNALEPGSDFAREIELVFGHPEDQIKRFRRELAGSFQPSVDAFLEKRLEYVELGKTVIALRLVPREIPMEIDRGNMNWLEYFLSYLDLSTEGFPENKLSVVTFNYDRSFEHHLHRALQDTNGLSSDDALSLLRKMQIVHVHGQLGSFANETGGESRVYEKDVSTETMKIAREGIIVLHEAESESQEFILARDVLSHAELICFVGFGYLAENVERLGVSPLADKKAHKTKPPHFFGSAYHLGLAEKARASRHFFGNITLGEETEDALMFLRNRVDLI